MNELAPANLLLERALPADKRKTFTEQLVRWYVNELNALGDRLRYQIEQREPDEEIVRTRRRCGDLLRALRWNAPVVIDVIWQWARDPLEMPEDAFAFGLVLHALGADRDRLRSWVASLHPESREMLRAWNVELA